MPGPQKPRRGVMAGRDRNIGQRQADDGNLLQKRLKKVMVAATDQGNPDPGTPERPGDPNPRPMTTT